MRAWLRTLLRWCSSLRVACVLLAFLALLTWLGTLEQASSGLFDVQKRYFESYLLWQDVGAFAVPLPGANLVLSLLALNLVLGGVVRLPRTRAKLGILITHLGILLLLGAGFIKLHYSTDGHVTLFEGQSAEHFESYYRWELAILEPLEGGRVREYIVPQERLAAATGAEPVRVQAPGLPFALEVSHFARNCRPIQTQAAPGASPSRAPVVGGVLLWPEGPLQEVEQEIAGCALRAVPMDGAGSDQRGLVWGLQTAPWTVHAAGRDWGIDLRHERHPLPFELELGEFHKTDHPGTSMPSSFASDVRVLDGGVARDVRISMNQPLRDSGLVLYQASWGPSNARPGQPLFSTFAVARNPADRMPLVACIVIAAGLLVHFSRKLALHLSAEARRA